jgi:SAM-dependent methyltransferase
LVVCNCVLEHVTDDGAALAGMARSLRPGGVLFLTVDSAEHGLALGFLERLPATVRGWLLRPEVAAAPTVSAGLDARLDELYAVLRRYRHDELVERLAGVGLAVLDSHPYLTGVGAAQYEAFHALRGLSTERGLGRVLYMLSSLLLYPLAAWSDNRRHARGYGLALVARKEGEGGR